MSVGDSTDAQGSNSSRAGARNPSAGSPHPSSGRRRPRSRLARLILTIVAVVAILGGLLAVRYLPVILDARAARDDAAQLAGELRGLQLGDLNQARLAQLHEEMAAVHAKLDSVRDFLSGGDPLVGVARGLSITRDSLAQADALVAAGEDVVQAGDIALGLGDQFVALRQQQAAGADHSLLAGAVQLMATSVGQVNQVQELIDEASRSLATIPPDANDTIRHAADLMAAPIETYGPLLAQYRSLDGVLPQILGWGGQKRYLVLAEDPAELRPTGGYEGTVGTVTFQNGQLTDHQFQDVYTLDLKPGIPFQQPPDALVNHLIGNASWQLADANWSPDFPTSAQEALRLYSLESGDTAVDGVIALTTYAVDRILEVTGPVEVADYGVTVKAGDVTLTALGLTRGVSSPTSTRKEFLSALSSAVLDRLFSLPPEQWQGLLASFQQVSAQRLMLVWFKDPAANALVAGTPIAGAVRQDPGDYLSIVEANMAPTSKYNLVVSRADTLQVALGANGDAGETLRMDWQNDSMKAGEPYASIRSYSTSPDGYYGAYVRVLTPATSSLVSASGQATDPITDPEAVTAEAGRNAFGNYLLMAPGASNLTYQWSVPAVATQAGGLWTYQLTLQKQPAMSPEQLSVRVTLPPGTTVVSLPDGASEAGGVVTLSATFTQDMQLQIRYQLQ